MLESTKQKNIQENDFLGFGIYRKEKGRKKKILIPCLKIWRKMQGKEHRKEDYISFQESLRERKWRGKIEW